MTYSVQLSTYCFCYCEANNTVIKLGGLRVLFRIFNLDHTCRNGRVWTKLLTFPYGHTLIFIFVVQLCAFQLVGGARKLLIIIGYFFIRCRQNVPNIRPWQSNGKNGDAHFNCNRQCCDCVTTALTVHV